MPVPVQKGLFTLGEGNDLRLLAGKCPECRRHSFPAQSDCPYCGASGSSVVPLSRTGTVEVATWVTNRSPGYDGPLPFGFGVVEVPEGIRVIARLAGDQALPSGTAVESAAEVIGTDVEGREVVSYSFRASPDAAAVSAPSGARAARREEVGRGSRFDRPVYIAGVGLHPFGRFEDKSLTDLGVLAVHQALRDADCRRDGFQTAYCATVYGGVAAGHKVLTAIGATGMPILNFEAGCASGGAALGLAARAIARGEYDRVLVFGIEKMPRGMIRSSFFEPWREQAGLAVTPGYFALRARRLMRDSGVSAEDLALVSARNHRKGVHNPYAMYRKDLGVEEILGSPMVCDPLRLYMMCAPNEGAAAVVLSANRNEGPAVRIAAASLRSHLPGSVLGEHTPLSGLAGPEPPTPTEMAAADAYESAAIDPADVEVIELQDTDSARELLSYEELGLCPSGGSASFLRADERRGINPSGGLLSKGEPLGPSGLAQVIELYWQLRGQAGRRQVGEASLALAHTVGRGANASVVILQR